MENDIKNEIRKFALQNASEHGGKTNDKVVLGKILGSIPEFRSKVKEITIEILPIVEKINSLSVQQQKQELEKDFPDTIQKKEKDKEKQESSSTLPQLEGAQPGKVITRFPPEPNGYPHIGHAKAAIINSEYVDMYGGKKILRFDDTNPENERKEFYAAIKVGLEWLGIKYDIEKNTSDDIKIIYQKGLQLVQENKAYVCTCKRDDMKNNRRAMKSCKCSRIYDDDKNGANKTLERWHKMFEKFKPGEAIVRFRGNMQSENTVMRDPVLFRIIEATHPLVGNEYRVWPSYDLAVAIQDSTEGVTHAFRSKEYELRNELYYAILDALHMRKPKMMEFSRLAFKGMPVSKRILKPLIEERKVSWYDDPRLPTLEAMRRRGIRAEAVKKFILSLGFTKSDTLAPFDALESFNRKIIDKDSIRLNMVIDPKKIIIADLPKSKIEMQNHPTVLDMGKRIVNVNSNNSNNATVAIASKDCEGIKPGDKLRLMGLGNIKITNVDSNNNTLEAQYIEDETNVDYPKIQWIPNETAHKIKILIPRPLFIDDKYNENSLEEIDVYTEPHYLELKDDTAIQFIRFGYCRKDSRNQAIYTHK